MKKKSLSLLIAVAMATTMVPSTMAFADTTAPVEDTQEPSYTEIKEAPASTYAVTYDTHIQKRGWDKSVKIVTGDQEDMEKFTDAGTSGTVGKALRVEALKLKGTNLPEGASIEYRVHQQTFGWSDVAKDGAEAGVTGKGKRAEAVQITLKGMPGYAIKYQVHVQSKGWMDPVVTENGTEAEKAAVAGTTGESKRIEAIRIQIVKTDAEKTAEVAAINAVAKAEATKTAEDIEAAKEAVAAVKDATVKAEQTAKVEAITGENPDQPEEPGECVVNTVSQITSKYVEVTFDALAEAKENVTVEVIDNNGEKVPVQAQDIPAGAVGAQFDFETEYAGKLEGVWTVNGVEYDFDAVAKLEAIINAATNGNQVKLLEALNNANVENVKEELIAGYLSALNSGSGDIEDIEDVQNIIDKVNADNLTQVEKDAIVTSVSESKTQVALLKALSNNFKRVNSEWVVDYVGGVGGTSNDSVAGFVITSVGTNGVVADGTSDPASALSYDDIQTIIDVVNARKINAADSVANTAEKQAEVTSLIKEWVEDDNPDTPDVTPKADAIEASEINRLGFVVAEAKTQNSLYNALVAYANATPDSVLKVSDLNPILKPEYLSKLDSVRSTAVSSFTANSSSASYDYKTNVVNAADSTALTSALATIDSLTGQSNISDIKKALQRLADITAHKTGLDKFDMSTVKEDQLSNYATGFANTASSSNNSLTTVNTTITTVNAGIDENKALETITNVKSTLEDVRSALLYLSLKHSNTTTNGFVNASTQAQKEYTQFIIDNRSSLASPLTSASITDDGNTSYSVNAIGKAMQDHSARLSKFNTIGNLAAATKLTIKTALDNYGYENYAKLTDAQKLEVADAIKGLTKDVSGTATPLDFSSNDAVTTFAEANAIIDNAIAEVVK